MKKVDKPENIYYKQVSVIIPAYNEEDIITDTLMHLDFEWIKEIIVINDGSEDETLKKALEFPLKIVNFKQNRGKGKAVEEGCQLVTGQVIALLDADLGKSVQNIEKLVLPVLKDQVDITIADIPIKLGGLGLVRGLAEKGLNFFYGKKFNSPLSGQRVFKRELLQDLLPFSKRFGLELGMDIDIIKNNWRVKEIKLNLKHKKFIDILLTLWQKRGI